MRNLVLALLLIFFIHTANAQFNVDGQIVQRGEYRHGFGQLIEEDADPAVFIGQRARIGVSYKTDNFNFYVSVQDVRIWGNTPQVKATDPFLSVHEAWAETKLSEFWTVKLGRQELNYDNFRFLGNLDWALQARSHDFALIKHEKESMKLHIGAGYNQTSERLTGNLFDLPNQYKTAQMVRYENKFDNLDLTLLYWNDGRQWFSVDSVGNVTDKGLRYRHTVGVPTLRYNLGNTTLSSFLYYQFGEDILGRSLNGFDVSAQISHLFDKDAERGKKFRLTGGFEIISGTATNSTDNINNSFSPLYGTNHLYNGYMDHFFVGGRFENSVGITDVFFRTRYDFNPKLFMSLNGHMLGAYAGVFDNAEKLDNRLGTELDVSLGWLINESVSLQSGYSQMFASDTYKYLQGVQNADNVQNWLYVMMIYRPTMKNRFIGMLF